LQAFLSADIFIQYFMEFSDVSSSEKANFLTHISDLELFLN